MSVLDALVDSIQLRAQSFHIVESLDDIVQHIDQATCINSTKAIGNTPGICVDQVPRPYIDSTRFIRTKYRSSLQL